MRLGVVLGGAAILIGLFAPAFAEESDEDRERDYTRAVGLYDGGHWREAAELCDRLIAADPEFAKPYYLRAWLYSQQGEARLAARVYLSLLQQAPAELDARLYYARVLLYDLRRFSEAEREFRSALAYAPEGDPRRARAEEGLAAVERERERGRLFRKQHEMLGWVLAALLAGWVTVAGVGLFLTRPDRSDATAS